MGDKQRSTIEMIQNLRTEKLSVREELALNLAYYSRAYGLSQTDLCERTGIPKSTMSQYFSGARYPRPAQLEALAGCFGITVGQLVGEHNFLLPVVYFVYPLYKWNLYTDPVW